MWACLLNVMEVRIVQKGGFLIEKGEIWLSNGMVLQSNHGCGYKPKDYLCDNQIAVIGFLVLLGLKEEVGKIQGLQ